MEITEQTRLKFHGVNIVKIDFASKQKPAGIELFPQFNANVKVFYPTTAGKASFFHLIMGIRIESENYFDLNIIGEGVFELTNREGIVTIDEDLKKRFVNENSPAIMFPYMRSFVSMLTANLGDTIAGAIILPTQFFKGELEELTTLAEEEPHK